MYAYSGKRNEIHRHIDDIKGENAKVDDPITDGKFHNNLKYKR